MTTTYTKSKTTDFGGNLDTAQLHIEIEVESNITKTLNSINLLSDGDTVEIIFAQALSTGEETTLNTLISGHIPVSIVNYSKQININPRKNNSKGSTYKRMANFRYSGSASMGEFSKITAKTYMQSGATNYSIRLLDDTNDKIIAENTFSNTDEETVELTPINNIPRYEANIEVLVKCSNNKKVYMENIDIYI